MVGGGGEIGEEHNHANPDLLASCGELDCSLGATLTRSAEADDQYDEMTRQTYTEETLKSVKLDVVNVDVVKKIPRMKEPDVKCGESKNVVNYETSTSEIATPPECVNLQLSNEKTKCKVVKGVCQNHKCSAKIVSNSRKEWAWLDNRKVYGWKYRKVKTIICEGLSLSQQDSDLTRCGGSMADQFGQISDNTVKGKVCADQRTMTNLSDGDVD